MFLQYKRTIGAPKQTRMQQNELYFKIVAVFQLSFFTKMADKMFPTTPPGMLIIPVVSRRNIASLESSWHMVNQKHMVSGMYSLSFLHKLTAKKLFVTENNQQFGSHATMWFSKHKAKRVREFDTTMRVMYGDVEEFCVTRRLFIETTFLSHNQQFFQILKLSFPKIAYFLESTACV